MKRRIKNLTTALLVLFALTAMNGAYAQDPISSITADELKGHIYFLASDYMGGRVGPTKEYEIFWCSI